MAACGNSVVTRSPMARLGTRPELGPAEELPSPRGHAKGPPDVLLGTRRGVEPAKEPYSINIWPCG